MTCKKKEKLILFFISQGLPDYVVFFSPSGFQYTVDGIGGNIIHLDRVKVFYFVDYELLKKSLA